MKKINNLSNDILSIGQVLKIPSVNDNIDIDDNYIEYKVVSGDSLYGIAKKYNTTVDEIKSINNLSSNLLSIGQILKIPNSNNFNRTYVVKSMDSIYSIAKKFDTTVDNLRNLNNLSNNLVSIGQILIIE